MSNWMWWALQSTVTVAVLVPVALLACRILRNRPGVQHLLWLALLVKFATPTLGTWPVAIGDWPERRAPVEHASLIQAPKIQSIPEAAAATGAAPDVGAVQVPPPDPQPAESMRNAPSLPANPPATANVSAVPPATTPGRISFAARTRAWATTGSMIAATAWFCGAIVQLIRQVGRTWRYVAVVRRARPAAPNLAAEAATVAATLGERPPRVLVSAEVASPFVWCLGPVRLLWPQSLTGPEQIAHARAILAHEMAHVRRRDHWTVWLDLGLGIVWWWNPVCWFVRRGLRESAEMACDALAISACQGRRRDYAELLLEMTAGLQQTCRPSPLAVGIGTQASFEKRLVMICSEGVSGKRSRVAVAMAIGLALVALPGWSIAPPRRGFVPSETIFPATTRAWLSIPDPEGLKEHFDRTPYGRLIADPSMRVFVEEFRKQVAEGGKQRLINLGLTLDDLAKVPGGELAVATIEAEPGRLCTVLLMDTTGHEADAKALVETITGRLVEQKATKVAMNGAPSQLSVYQLPSDPHDARGDATPRDRRVALAQAASALVVGDDPLEVGQAFAVLAQGRADSLATVPGFVAVNKRVGKELADTAAPVRWFVDPFGFAKAYQASNPPREKRKGPDYVAILGRQGFDAVKGIGGVVAFDHAGHSLRHHTLVHAPALPGREPFGPERFDLAARMLRFPDTEAVAPPAWAPRELAGWTALQWDMQTAFASVETLFDDIVGEKGTFDDVIASLKEDPDGPQIDLEKDMVACLGKRVVLLSHHVEPIGTDSERLVIAIEATDPQRVAATVAKTMAADSDMRKIQIGSHEVWELIDRSMAIPTIEVETPGGAVVHADRHEGDDDAAHRRRQRLREKEEKLLPHSAVTVAHGHLLIASHRDILERVLANPGGADALAAAADYKAAAAELARLVPGKAALRAFGREDETIKPTYELLRQGSMPKSKSVFGQLLNGILGDGKPGTVREQKIDGSTLPEFETVRRYLGTACLGMESTADGWYFVGASLPRDQNEPEVPRRNAADP